MREWCVRGAMGIAAIVQCAPIVGLAGKSALSKLYGLAAIDPTTELLLRHRAMLLAIVGVLIALGAAHPPLRWPAIALGLLSKATFVALFVARRGEVESLSRIAIADCVTIVALLIAAALTPR